MLTMNWGHRVSITPLLLKIMRAGVTSLGASTCVGVIDIKDFSATSLQRCQGDHTTHGVEGKLKDN